MSGNFGEVLEDFEKRIKALEDKVFPLENKVPKVEVPEVLPKKS